MSIRLMDAALDLPLDSTSKLVLVVLADHANNDGDGIYPGNTKIARRASISIRQTSRVLKHIEDHGIISRVKYPKGGHGKSVEWAINVGVIALIRSTRTPTSTLNLDVCYTKGCHLIQTTRTWVSTQPSGTIMNPGEHQIPELPERREGESMGEWLDRIAEQNTN